MKSLPSKFALLLVSFVVPAACGGSEPEPQAPGPAAPPTETAAPPTAATGDAPPAATTPAAGADAGAESMVTPQQVPWKDMTKKQRGMYMAHAVQPKMKEVFTELDAKRHAEFDCKSCHGAGAVDQSFTMPNPELPKLPDTPAGFAALAKKKPKAMKFMSEKVQPEMAKLLGVPAMDPKNPVEGAFGCMNCHTTQASATKAPAPKK